MAQVLVVIADGAEEIETMAVADVLVRGGHEVCIAGDSLEITGSRGLPMRASLLIDDAVDQDYDLVYLPGGLPQAEFCRDDARVQALIAKQIQRQDALLAIICACPISLLPQGLAKGRQVTSHPGKQAEMEEQATWTGARIQRDGNLITSQGPGTSIELGLYLVQALGGTVSSEEIANGMLAYLPTSAE